MPDTYTNGQINILLNHFLRNTLRPMPFPKAARYMGVEVEWTGRAGEHPFTRVLWGLWTGYGSPVDRDNPAGPRKRREYAPTAARRARWGWPWHKREDVALRHALGGAGQQRVPPVDVAYIATVLMRLEVEVTARWAELCADPLGREGFGLGGS